MSEETGIKILTPLYIYKAHMRLYIFFLPMFQLPTTYAPEDLLNLKIHGKG